MPLQIRDKFTTTSHCDLLVVLILVCGPNGGAWTQGLCDVLCRGFSQIDSCYGFEGIVTACHCLQRQFCDWVSTGWCTEATECRYNCFIFFLKSNNNLLLSCFPSLPSLTPFQCSYSAIPYRNPSLMHDFPVSQPGSCIPHIFLMPLVHQLQSPDIVLVARSSLGNWSGCSIKWSCSHRCRRGWCACTLLL